MFKWLKRHALAASPAKSSTARAARPRPATPRFANTQPFAASMPLPEVVGEGNTQADWSAWEDSMLSLDSQLQELTPTQRIYVREARPSQFDDDDPFSSVRRRRAGS